MELTVKCQELNSDAVIFQFFQSLSVYDKDTKQDIVSAQTFVKIMSEIELKIFGDLAKKQDKDDNEKQFNLDNDIFTLDNRDNVKSIINSIKQKLDYARAQAPKNDKLDFFNEMNILINELSSQADFLEDENLKLQNSTYQYIMEKDIVKIKVQNLEDDLQNYADLGQNLEYDYQSLTTSYENLQEELQKAKENQKNHLKGERLISELEMNSKYQDRKIRDLEAKSKELTQQLKDSTDKNNQLYEFIQQYENDQNKEIVLEKSNSGINMQRQNDQEVDILLEDNNILQQSILKLQELLVKYEEELELKDIGISRLEHDNQLLKENLEGIDQMPRSSVFPTTRNSVFPKTRNSVFPTTRNSVFPATDQKTRISVFPQMNDRFSIFSETQKERISTTNFSLEERESSFRNRNTDSQRHTYTQQQNIDEEWKTSQVDNWANESQESEIKLNINWDSWAKTIVQDVEDQDIHRIYNSKGTNFDSEKNKVLQKYLKFDETELLKHDYLNLRDNEKIKVIINNNMTENLLQLRTFSDNIFRINSKGDRERRILLMTTTNIYVLKPDFKIIRIIYIKNIFKVTFSISNMNMIALHIVKEFDYLIETFRRVQMNTFLIECFKEQELESYKMDFSDDFNISFRNKVTKNIGDLNKNSIQNEFQALYKDSIKQGFLMMYNKHNALLIFASNWKEFFLVLTNLGLFVFKEAGNMENNKLIPINKDANLIMDPLDMVKTTKYVLKINYTTSDQEFFFAAQSKQEQEDWYEAIHQVIIRSLNLNINQQKDKQEQNTYKKTILRAVTEEFVQD